MNGNNLTKMKIKAPYPADNNGDDRLYYCETSNYASNLDANLSNKIIINTHSSSDIVFREQYLKNLI